MNVTVARCESSITRAPAFYGSLLICMLAQSFVFWFATAPAYLIGVPIVVSAFAATRLYWCIVGRKTTTTKETAEADLRRSTIVISLVALVVLAFDIALMQHLDEVAALYILFTLVTWCIVAVCCIFYIIGAAVTVMSAPLVGMLFAWSALNPKMALGLSVFVVGAVAASTFSMRRHYGDFISLIEARASAQKLSDDNLRLANTDALTELAGRRHFFSELERLSAQARAKGKVLAVAIADLDGFKPINDRHGHLIGDRVLQVVASRIQDGFGQFKSAYRLGGDEFALLAPDVSDEHALMWDAEALIACVRQTITLGNISVTTGCSVGIALATEPSLTTNALYERADYALHHAKRAGRNMATRFTDEHEGLIRSKATVEQELRGADIDREFYLAYQPIVRARTGEVIGFECLARWRSPALGDVAPATFIPIAEQTGLLKSIAPILLRKALADAAAWPATLRLSFNLSPADIASSRQIMTMIGILGESAISPTRIDFELTETALLHDFSAVCENMAALKTIGANISLDDFGTGYSSLSHLHALPLDKIKIDRSFVHNVEHDASGQTIVRSIINLCRDLDLACVVEGVETAEQLKKLREFGAELLIQGYFFGKPMEAAHIPAYLSGVATAA